MVRKRDSRREVGYGGNFEGNRCYYGEMFPELGFPVAGVCGNGGWLFAGGDAICACNSGNWDRGKRAD